MKRDLLVLFVIALAVFLVFHRSFNNFFAQDDFILINHFSQNSLSTDIIHVFGKAYVTHWRPLHNLYFLISGNLFGKDYVLYHNFTFLIHIGASFLIYKIVRTILFSDSVSTIAALIYAAHPSHFVTLFWISGGATTIGLFFFLISFYFYLTKKEMLSTLFYVVSLLASEAMLAGLLILGAYDHLYRKKFKIRFYGPLLGLSLIFIFSKILFLKPESLQEFYSLNFSAKVIDAINYYLVRIAGFGETSSDIIESFILTLWLSLAGLFLFKRIVLRKDLKDVIFAIILILSGLFPFAFLPNHLSPHYMNISVFGFALLIATVTQPFSLKKKFYYCGFFVLIALLVVNKTFQNNWVVKRSEIAKTYINLIYESNIPAQSTIVFNDNYISTSQEAYFAIETGKALDFWFKDKNYKSCFSWIENCESVQ